MKKYQAEMDKRCRDSGEKKITGSCDNWECLKDVA